MAGQKILHSSDSFFQKFDLVQNQIEPNILNSNLLLLLFAQKTHLGNIVKLAQLSILEITKIKQARKARSCDSNIQSETMNDPLTHSPLTGDAMASKKTH